MHSFLDGLAQLWARALGTQPNPRPEVLFGTAAAALLAVGYGGTWRVLRIVVTTAHEAGHALVALCVGRRLSRIELHSDTSGVTISRGRARGPGMVATLLAGYLSPSLLGLVAALLLSAGYVTGMLVLTVVAALLLLLRVRGGYGILAVLAIAAVVFVVVWFAQAQAQAVFGYAFCWFLLFGGVRPVWELRGSRGGRSDADQLARLTGVTRGFWMAGFGLVDLAILAAGVGVLVPRAVQSVTELGTMLAR